MAGVAGAVVLQDRGKWIVLNEGIDMKFLDTKNKLQIVLLCIAILCFTGSLYLNIAGTLAFNISLCGIGLMLLGERFLFWRWRKKQSKQKIEEEVPSSFYEDSVAGRVTVPEPNRDRYQAQSPLISAILDESDREDWLRAREAACRNNRSNMPLAPISVPIRSSVFDDDDDDDSNSLDFGDFGGGDLGVGGESGGGGSSGDW